MDRYEKIKEVELLSSKNKIIDYMILDYGMRYPNLQTEREENNKKIREIYDTATKVLISSQKKDEEYYHFYYLVELDRVYLRESDNPNEHCDIDMRDYFESFNFPTNTKNHSTTLRYAHAIMKSLILDLFSRKDYQSWEEVKQDLLRIREEYSLPTEPLKQPVYEKKNNIK